LGVENLAALGIWSANAPRTERVQVSGTRPQQARPLGFESHMSRFRTAMRILTLVSLVFFASTVFAHHSFAMFDKNRKVELVGVVTRFEWTNPHSYIVISVTENGKEQEYTIETGAPGSLIRLDDRWRSDIIKPGDTVKVLMNPLKNGQPGGALVDLITPDGHVLGQHAPKPDVRPLAGH
jgi:uncharacterized protein DUF6152